MPKKTALAAEFTTNAWSGKTHYQCNTCSFDTFDELELLRHLVNIHDSEAALASLLSIEEEVKNAKNDIS